MAPLTQVLLHVVVLTSTTEANGPDWMEDEPA